MTRTSSYSAALGLAGLVFLGSCGDGGSSDQPGTAANPGSGDAIGGLIAARNEGAGDPSLFVILRPSGDDPLAEGWTEERVQGVDRRVSLWIGELPNGDTVWRCVDEADGPLDTPMRLTPGDDAWTLEPWEGIALEDVEWKTSGGEPSTFDYQLVDGNVFHKAMYFEPRFGEPGILTISGNVGVMKIWRKNDGAWTSEQLWTDFIGDQQQRIRDVEVGDVDGDGEDELVVVTHNRGGVYVLEQTEGGLEATMVASTDESIFVHEVEIGQADDDAALEFFTTPSEPNLFDGTDQAGRVDRYDFVDGQYVQSTVEDDPKSHAKEVLAVDMDGDGKVEIYAALEGPGLRPDFTGDGPGHLASYTFGADGSVTKEIINDLKGPMCRFLSVGDIDGDGRPQIVASTSRDGIFSFSRADDGTWDRRKVAGGFRSSGFEHAMVVVDVNGDGIDEVVAASDKEKQVQAFEWDGEKGRWVPDKLLDVDVASYMTWGILPIPAGH